MYHANLKEYIPNCSGEEVDFVVFCCCCFFIYIFRNSGHPGFLAFNKKT